MNIKTVAFLFGLITPIVHAQPFNSEKPVICEKTKDVIEYLSGPEWREEPFWAGRDDRSRYVLMTNERTGTWSIVQFNGEIACVIGTGETGGPVTKPRSKTIRS